MTCIECGDDVDVILFERCGDCGTEPLCVDCYYDHECGWEEE